MPPTKPKTFTKKLLAYRSWDSIVRAEQLRKRGPIPSKGKKFFSSPKYPNWL
jgi:hypothetical protein